MVKKEAAEARDPLLGSLQGLEPEIRDGLLTPVLGISASTPPPAYLPLHMFPLPGKPSSSLQALILENLNFDS